MDYSSAFNVLVHRGSAFGVAWRNERRRCRNRYNEGFKDDIRMLDKDRHIFAADVQAFMKANGLTSNLLAERLGLSPVFVDRAAVGRGHIPDGIKEIIKNHVQRRTK
jgi:hypothetical protein